MAKFDAISALDTLFSTFDPTKVPNLTVKPDFLRSIRENAASDVRLIIQGEDFVPTKSNGVYRNERYNVRGRLQTIKKDSNAEQVFDDTMIEYERLMGINNVDEDRDAEFELEYQNKVGSSAIDILFIVSRWSVKIIP